MMKKVESYLLDNLNEFVGFARKRLGDPELAADAVQESLLKALKALWGLAQCPAGVDAEGRRPAT